MTITTGPADKMTIGVFKMIHDTVFTEKLSDEMYLLIKEGKEAIGLIAYMNGDVAVGCVAGKVDKKKFVVSSLAVLEAYRKMGAATELMKAAENLPKIDMIEVHAPTGNEAVNAILRNLQYQEGPKDGDNVVYTKKVQNKSK